MANINLTGFNLQGIKNSTVVNMTVSTLKDTFQKLSDGLKVSQDPGNAALQEEDTLPLMDLANKFAAHVQSLNEATLSANDGVAMVQLMDAGLSDIQAGLDQIQDLALRSASSLLSGQERQALQLQAEQIQADIAAKVQSTSYNDISLLATQKTILLETDVGADTQLSIKLRDFSNAFAPVDLTNRSGAEAALSFLQEDINRVDAARKQVAIQDESVGKTVESLQAMSTYLNGTGEVIQSAELAQAIASAAAATIRAHPGMAIHAQANQSAVKVQALV